MELIRKTIRALNAHPARTAFIGASISDIEAARSAGIGSIGYANEPSKFEHMTAANAGAVISSLADLALRLRARPTVELCRTGFSPRLRSAPG
jgi:phosphoglycolate phosphatase-like HAD superfamily hydrolase